MNYRYYAVILSLLAVFFISSCGTDRIAEIYSINLESTIAIANERRSLVFERDMDRIQREIYGKNPSIINDPRIFSNTPRSVLVTSEEALEDIEIFFSLLRNLYGAYNHFGGDEVFIPLFDKIKAEISTTESQVSVMLGMLLRDFLSDYISDNHFAIDGVTVGSQTHVFIWDSPFDRSRNGFRHRESQKYAVEIVGHSISEIMRLAVTESGEFFYVPIVMLPSVYGITYDLQIDFQDEGIRTISLRHTLFPMLNSSADIQTVLNMEYEFPVVSLRPNMPSPFAISNETFGFSSDNAVSFLSFAEMLINEPVIILDLRSNAGGFSILSTLWLYKLLDEFVPYGFYYIMPSGIVLPDDMYSLSPSWYLFFNHDEQDTINSQVLEVSRKVEMITLLKQGTQINDYHSVIGKADRVVSNDLLLILLVDRHTASAAEIFTRQILNIENTLVIGQNTSGTLLTSGSLPLWMPNSGIPFHMGWNFMALPDDGNQREGFGISPDVWVLGDALTAALAILNNR